MKKLKVKLENNHGISKIDQEFDFSKFRTFLIYASNGVMKTSFAKTFEDYIQNRPSQDKVLKSKKYQRSIIKDDKQTLNSENIFVINSFINTEYVSDEISTLLVNEKLRKEYQEILEKLHQTKKDIIKKLKISSSSSDCEKEIIQTFQEFGENFYQIIDHLLDQITDQTFANYDFKYNVIFDNLTIENFIEENQENLNSYFQKYFELLKNSQDLFSEDGNFGTPQAYKLLSALSDEGYFKTGHQIKLKNGQIITSYSQLREIIDQQINQIIQNSALRMIFRDIDKILHANNMQDFREIIQHDPSILLELNDLKQFKQKYWLSHLSKLSDEIKNLHNSYSKNRDKLQKIIIQAKKEIPEWQIIIETFRKRFVNMPFNIELQNKPDLVVLGLEKPELTFQFIDQNTKKSHPIDKELLTERILSQGERRAFYLLNIIFEIRARLKKNQETLFIIDDIADSFDYKNKYAIVEYLNDLAKEPNFYSIILTHNFDFFRTLQSRVLTEKYKRTHSFIAEKRAEEIQLISAGEKKFTNPFEKWREELNHNQKYLIASIPFIRNLIEFQQGKKSPNYQILTNLLHFINRSENVLNTADITIKDLEKTFSSILKDINFTFEDKNKKIIDIIDQELKEIINDQNLEAISLENKIILSIGIRLKAEQYMWSKVKNKKSLGSNQTGKLFERFKKDYSKKPKYQSAIQTLERVMVMTPSNIHLNSFMYEPIVDLGIDELKNLYQEVERLLG